MCECQVISVVYMNTFQKTKREKKKKKAASAAFCLQVIKRFTQVSSPCCGDSGRFGVCARQMHTLTLRVNTYPLSPLYDNLSFFFFRCCRNECAVSVRSFTFRARCRLTAVWFLSLVRCVPLPADLFSTSLVFFFLFALFQQIGVFAFI